MARISIEQKTLFIFLLVFIVLATAVIIYQFSTPKTITNYNYYGIPMKFRVDLRQAENISVYPDSLRIYDAMWNPELDSITIIFVNSSDNSLVLVEAFEIAFKLKLAYEHFNSYVNITAREIDSYENITSDERSLTIALIPPSLTDETIVKIENSTIFIKGKTKDEFDMATVKFLMSVLDIKVG